MKIRNKLILSSALLMSSLTFASASEVNIASAVSLSSSTVPFAQLVDEMTQRAKELTKQRVEDIKNYLHNYDMNEPDLWLYNPSPKDSVPGEAKITRRQAPEAGQDIGWLALRPGDAIYYTGVSGIKNFAHAGTYIGNGLVFEKWSEGGPADGKGVVVINEIENFGTAASEVASLDPKGCFKRRSCIKKEANIYRQVFLF